MIAAQRSRSMLADAPRPTASPRGRLAAIVVADVQGFCTLIRSDLNGTVARMQAMRETVEPILVEHGGRLVKTTGDGYIAEFTSAAEAVLASRLVQDALRATAARPGLALRIGVSLGEVVVDADGEIFGDAVNLAARIEPFAGAGGIVVTGAVRDQLAGRPDLPFDDMGPHRVKGFEQPVAVFRLVDAARAAPLPTAAPAGTLSALAVLPFRAISADPAAAILADAVTEDLTTCLSRVPGLLVIARFSAASHGGTGSDPARAAAALGVRFIVEGAIRALGDHVHVNARLIDMRAGAAQAWSGSFDIPLPELGGAAEPEIARRIGARIGIEAMLAELRAGREGGPIERDAWQRTRLAYTALVQRSWSEATLREVEEHCRAAIALDPDLALPRAVLALALAFCRRFSTACPDRTREATEAARAAIVRAPRDAETLGFAGFALVELGQGREGGAILRRATDLDPGNPLALVALGAHLLAAGEWEAGFAAMRRGIGSSPQDPRLAVWRSLLAGWLFMAERDEEALVEAHGAIEADPAFAPAWLMLAAAWGGLDDPAAAHGALERALQLQPTLLPEHAVAWGGPRAVDAVARR
ncbi:MAG TPA: adenylate/guanylate cyclase domain-containing protein [Salinarimonas sp.]|jgi:adenylate cyclase|nr:adenylate/guanylate cyclase domain-containing protein [Salinarimonas sp.]